MTCREVIDFLMVYLDGTLPPDQRADFESHLAVCPSCVAYLNSYKATVRLGKDAFAAPEQPASGLVPESLLNAIRAARKV